MRTIEQLMRDALDGTLTFICPHTGQVITKDVERNHIPTHDNHNLDRPNTCRRWTAAEDAQLVEMVMARVSRSEIAEAFGRDDEAVKRRIGRLRMAGRVR